MFPFHSSVHPIFFNLQESPIDCTSPNGEELPTVQGTLSLKAVKFNYPIRPDVLILNYACVNLGHQRFYYQVGRGEKGGEALNN